MKKVLVILLFLNSFYGAAQLKVNEIMSNNISAVMDESYNYSMWVELYNSGGEDEDQGNYYFTDQLTEPQKWKPASKTIAAGEFAILWFERDELDGHANFKLEPGGGKLYLLDSLGAVVDQVTYPKQYRNASYGRKTDGADKWVYFVEYSDSASNDNRKSATAACTKPEFTVQGSGFYSKFIYVSFARPQSGETVYYTTDASEPTDKSLVYTPGSRLLITKTTIIRAIALSANKMPSEILSGTYFINSRNFHLPVVSIITEQKNLTNDTIGIYVIGTNGIAGNCTDSLVNWNQDWDRPANFELFDANGVVRLNQELDIAIAGNCSRYTNAQKSLKISPRKKFGNNKLTPVGTYDLFSSKPDHKYKDIQIRNSGNDFGKTMMRDGFMQSLIIDRMDIDYLAYEPAVCFINGVYYGIQNLRERSSKDYLYSNYDLDEEDFDLLEGPEEVVENADYMQLIDCLVEQTIEDPTVYAEVNKSLDIDNYLNYLIAEFYYANTDWPGGNFKVWKKKENGKWRCILYDTDMGFAANRNVADKVYYSNYNQNPFSNGSIINPPNKGFITYPFKRLINNPTFKEKFINRFCVQLSSTFETSRVDQIMDSIVSKISAEMVYHKQKWHLSQNFNTEIAAMKEFSAHRPDSMMKYLSEQYLDSVDIRHIRISSNIENASYRFFTENITDNRIDLKYFKGQPITVQARAARGYTFKRWEYQYLSSPADTVSSTAPTDTIPPTVLTDTTFFSTEPIFTDTLTYDIQLKAVYEPSGQTLNKIYINEISGNEKWLEIYNAEDVEVDLSGFVLQKIDEDGIPANWSIPNGTTIDPKGFIAWTQNVGASFTWGISAKKDVAFKIFDADGTELDFFEVKMPELNSDGGTKTVGRETDGAPDLILFPTGTKGTSNNPDPDGNTTVEARPSVRVRPNPVRDILYIETDAETIPTVRLYSMYGKLMLQTQSKQVNLSPLSAGMYLLQVEGTVIKVIKK